MVTSSPGSLAIRVSLAFQDCSGILLKWASRCSKVLIYEHEEDEDVSRTHIHMAAIGLDCKTEALKRMWADAPGKGNEFWSFSPLRDESKYLAYMTKGKLRPVFSKNFSPADVEGHLLSWVDPVKDATGKVDSLEYYVSLVMSKIHKKTLHEFMEDNFTVPCSDTYHSGSGCICNAFDIVRKQTFKIYWGVNRRVPHASQYKMIASTAFLRMCEDWLCLERGLETVKNLWY